MPSSRSRYLAPCALAWVAFVTLLGFTARAEADTLLPPGNKVFFGVTDTGQAEGYRSFAQAVGKRPAVIQTFHPWGNTLSKSMPRWRSIKATLAPSPAAPAAETSPAVPAPMTTRW